ncbi:MAG: hypothetical protein C4291_11075 [Candidatus Dadabacteria bacterium]
MSNEEIKKLEEELENIRKAKEGIKESFSHMPDIQSKILNDLNAREKLLIEFIKEKRKEV